MPHSKHHVPTEYATAMEAEAPPVVEADYARTEVHLNGLQQSEELYHKMIEEVEDYAIVLLDENGIIQNWNKGAEKIKGYHESEIVGKSFSNFYFEEDRINGLPDRLLNEAREKGRAIHEGWRRRKDGSRFWGSIVITALHDNNRIVGFSKVTRDLTERKTAEDQLKEYATQLEFQNKELEQFAYAASHDMKEPLRKISFYNQFIFDHASNQLDEKSRDYMLRSLNAARRMSNLIDDLLTYSHTQSPVDNFRETDMDKIVDDIINSHKDLLEQKKLVINKHGLPVLHAIPFQMKQLMDNLINNSIQYKHPDRAAIIGIACEKLTADLVNKKEALPGQDYYKISVTDNGSGFEQEHAEKIFEVFQRISSPLGYRGSGIGLAICKRIAQNHHGFIIATGKENEGAVFDVFLPVR